MCFVLFLVYDSMFPYPYSMRSFLDLHVTVELFFLFGVRKKKKKKKKKKTWSCDDVTQSIAYTQTFFFLSLQMQSSP